MNLIILFNEYVKLLLIIENEEKKGNVGTYQYNCIVVTKSQIKNKFLELILVSTRQDIDLLLTSIEHECEKLKKEIEFFEKSRGMFGENEDSMIDFANYRLEYLNRKLQKYIELCEIIRDFTDNKVYTLKLK